MGFTIAFLWNLAAGVLQGAPLFLGLSAIIAGLSVIVGRGEGWSVGESLYFGFITATTVGYGDLRPTRPRGRLLAVMLALFGLILTGILVALAVQAASATLAKHGAG